MKRETLLQACEFAAKPIGGTHNIPIIECLHIVSDGDTATITGGNMDTFCRFTVPCETKLALCVPARRLLKILALAAADDIELTAKGDVLTVKGSGLATLDTLPADDYPEWVTVKGDDFPIPSAAFKQVLPAASIEQSRYTLQSAYLDKRGFIVAADGRRMHFVKVPEMPCDGILPAAVAKMLSGVEGVMRTDGQRFLASGESWEITGKMIEGNYPVWQKMLMETNPGVPVPDDLAAIIARAAGSSDDKICGRVDFEAGMIRSRKFHEPVDLDLGFKCGVSPSNMIDALREAGDGATISGAKSERGILIVNGDFTALVGVMAVIEQ